MLTVSDRGDNVAFWQIPIVTTVVLIVIFLYFGEPKIFTKITFFLGFFVILGNALWAVLSSITPRPAASRLRFVIPMIDIAGITLMTANEDGLALSVLFLIPLTFIAGSSSAAVSSFTSLATSGLLVLTTVFGNGGISGERGMWLLIFPIVSFVLCRIINKLSQLTKAKGRLLVIQLEETRRSRERGIFQQESLDFILTAVNVAILRIGKNGELTYANRAYREFLTRSGREPGSTFGDGIYHEDRNTPYNDADHPMYRTLRGQALLSKVVWFGAPGVNKHPFHIDALRFTDSEGMFTGAIFALTDITEEMQLNQVREDFVITMSHEIRNPLTSVVGNLDIALESDLLPPHIRKNLKTATDNSLRILDLVTRLLDGISLGEEPHPPPPQPTNLVALLREGCDSIAPAASMGAIMIHCHLVEPIMVNVDPLKALQVIENVLSNAVKYNRGGGTITITASPRSLANSPDDTMATSVELRIKDTGPGIPLQEQENIFRRFYRTTSARKSGVVGTGLGLSISRKMMREMGGDLLIESAASQGTTAICVFPLHNVIAPLVRSEIPLADKGVYLA